MASQTGFQMDNFIGQSLGSFSFLILLYESQAFQSLIESGTSFELLFPALIYCCHPIYSKFGFKFLVLFS
jgi:hypothetical protein